MPTISVIVITKNEERNIRECLETVRWANEIVVADDGSEDKTIEIAKEFTDKTYMHAWLGYGAAKNFALSHCTSEWVLSLDADERVTPELQAEIISAITSAAPDIVAFNMPRRANFLGRWINHCGWYPGRITRVFRRNAGLFSEEKVHERLKVNGLTYSLKSDLLHYTDPDLVHYFEKFNNYTSLAAAELKEKGKKFNLLNLVVNPLWVFVRMYVLRLGFLDGIPGLILCILSANYVFTKYAKLWECSIRNKGIKL
jgi:glycosyltransferase involved in cell wall biosynthesis